MNIKRMLSGILTTCVISASFLSALPVSAQTITEGAHIQVTTEEQNNLQTAASPPKEFTINNKKDFSKFMKTEEYWENNYKIKLNCNISWILTKKFNPIEDFKGVFDGGGHTIKNVKLRCFAKNNHGNISRLNFQKSKSLVSECGFVENNYGTISDCTSKGNIERYEDGSIKRDEYVGGFVGINHADATITNCTATGNVKGKINAGGFVAKNDGTISKCASKGNVKVAGYYSIKVGSPSRNIICNNAGGFVADNYGTITDCSAKGNVHGPANVGGFAGSNYGVINNCAAKGEVEGNTNVGGFVGWNEGTITNCSIKGNVKGNDYVSGFVGVNYGTISECTSEGNVGPNAYSIYAGGFVKDNYGTITKCTSKGNINSFAGKNKGKIEDCTIIT